MENPEDGGGGVRGASQENEPRSPFGWDTARAGGATDLGSVGASDEKLWSVLAHVSMLVAPIGALAIWLIYKDRSPKVRFHASQALWYQLAWLVILTVYVVLSIVLTFVVIGIFMFFLLPLVALVPLAHGLYAAYRVSQGEDYRYPFIADRIDGGRRRVV